MAKRSKLGRKPRDFYPTPYEAVLPLLPFLTCESFVEPCAGDGQLIRNLNHIHCQFAFDIEPDDDNILRLDALNWNTPTDTIITNPPYKRDMFIPLLSHFLNIAKVTWLLLPADFAYNKYMSKYLAHCELIVAVGRVTWFEGTKVKSMENYAWYKFTQEKTVTHFVGV